MTQPLDILGKVYGWDGDIEKERLNQCRLLIGVPAISALESRRNVDGGRCNEVRDRLESLISNFNYGRFLCLPESLNNALVLRRT